MKIKGEAMTTVEKDVTLGLRKELLMIKGRRVVSGECNRTLCSQNTFRTVERA